jgi:hypothetical protein
MIGPKSIKNYPGNQYQDGGMIFSEEKDRDSSYRCLSLPESPVVRLLQLHGGQFLKPLSGAIWKIMVISLLDIVKNISTKVSMGELQKARSFNRANRF